jgi:HK97 family phage major capsid protein
MKQLSIIDGVEYRDYFKPVPKTLCNPGSSTSAGRQRSGEFRSLGDFLQAVARSETPGYGIDSRLQQRAATGLGESIPSDGGFLVNTDFAPDLIGSAFEGGSKLANLCNRMQISANSSGIKLPCIDETSRANGSRWGGVLSYWTNEAAEKIASRPKFRQMELVLQKLIGLCYTTDELLQDSSILETVVRQSFIDEIGFRIDDAIVQGNGAGMPLGILNSGCLVTVAAEAGQRADTIIWENVVKIWKRMPARNRANAVWLINQDTEDQLYSLSLSVGTGGIPVFMPSGGASNAPYASLFGRPIMPIEQCSTLGDLGDILLADLGAYILADKGAIQTDVSIHVRYIWDESCYRFVYRCCGQPMYASPFTPYKGAANTQSPFVTLQARD